jgi:hypothetical protein
MHSFKHTDIYLQQFDLLVPPSAHPIIPRYVVPPPCPKEENTLHSLKRNSPSLKIVDVLWEELIRSSRQLKLKETKIYSHGGPQYIPYGFGIQLSSLIKMYKKKMLQLQNVRVQKTKHPNYKTSQIQNIPNTKCSKLQNVLSFKTFKLQNVPTTKHPNNKASQIQTIAATNVPSYIVPGKKHPRYKMSQASKCPN